MNLYWYLIISTLLVSCSHKSLFNFPLVKSLIQKDGEININSEIIDPIIKKEKPENKTDPKDKEDNPGKSDWEPKPLGEMLSNSYPAFSAPFNDSSIGDFKNEEKCCQHSIQFDNQDQSVTFLLNNQDHQQLGFSRSMLAKSNSSSLSFDQNYIFYFSMKFPANYEVDPTTAVFFELKGQKDEHLGETGRSSVVDLRVTGENMKLCIKWDENELSSNSTIKSKCLDIDTIKINEWMHFSGKIRLSYTDSGLIHLFLNNEEKLNHLGPNAYNDIEAPYLKCGINKWLYIPGGSAQATSNKTEVSFKNLYLFSE